QHLNAQVIFLVDHNGERFIAADRHGARHVIAGGGVLTADEVALDEQLPFQRRALSEVDPKDVVGDAAVGDLRAAALEHLETLAATGAADEREAGKIARQSDAAGDDNLAVRPHATQPFPRMIVHLPDFSHNDLSSNCRMSSRSLAASS